MKTEIKISPENQAILDLIKSTGKTWYEISLPDHPIYPQFARKLVVTGFNTPDMEGEEERIYVNVRQYLILKEGNKIHKRLIMPNWEIHQGNVEEIMGADGHLITQTVIEKDDEDNVISEKIETIKTSSIQYVRFLIKSKSVHLVDIFGKFMSLYAQLFEEKINDI
ncbi:hypothetical protein [Chryseobacterium salviniae]|uniref:Uncharacterized protein n=1 Tax=Chryseobacterium salviniae TaxID=3101750 RepID=A0ABU6HSP7_9FLAO|nr:hypothetical protein [Chryseobacterium sp. T9W2-O]MEC3875923.1 hypothetical protein [Chryseobacterium sp. T9W2-O]